MYEMVAAILFAISKLVMQLSSINLFFMLSKRIIDNNNGDNVTLELLYNDVCLQF